VKETKKDTNPKCIRKKDVIIRRKSLWRPGKALEEEVDMAATTAASDTTASSAVDTAATTVAVAACH
jgi:hypothetical protein